ncbi:MAG: hypothetical protein LUQ67_06465 [Methanomicrobiales archaeon]|nr:hypothetical protein [Methanomicrobiales archaeon]
MKKSHLFLALIALIALTTFLAGCATQPSGGVTPTPTTVVTTQAPVPGAIYSQAAVDFKLGMRKLWTDHAVWTRMYIIESLDNSDAAGPAAERLLLNQEDIGNAIKPVYGDAAGDQLTALLKDHILIAVDIIDAVKAKNATAQAAAEARWTANADEIATFLASANPNWPKATLQNLLSMHLSTTKDELVARYTKNYPADVAAWDAVYNHILVMADALSDGILKQYPGKFAGPAVYTQSQMDLRNNMRKLWTDHTVWTRLYIIESLNDSPAASNAAGRLLQNQVDIGNAIKPVYGDAAGNQLTELLRQHILIAVDIIDAVKAKNATAQAEAETAWTTNADQIATFLAGANPNWPVQTLKDLLHMHLSTTKDELVARYTKNYPADVTAYDTVYDHILTMSDALTDGIMAQFPAKFTT